jgi:hypothetical protein
MYCPPVIINTQLVFKNMAVIYVKGIYPLIPNSMVKLIMDFGNSILPETMPNITYQTMITESSTTNTYLIGGGGTSLTGNLTQITGSARLNIILQASRFPRGIPLELNGAIIITTKPDNHTIALISSDCYGVLPVANNDNNIKAVIKGTGEITHYCGIKTITFKTGQIKVTIGNNN